MNLRVNKTIITYTFAAFLLMTICMIMNEICNVDIIGMTVYIVFLIYIYKKSGNCFIKYVRFFIMATYHLVSVFIVNNYKIYFYNLQEYSSDIGAFVPLATAYIVEFGIIFILECNKDSKILNKLSNIKIGENGFFENSKRKKQLIKITSFVLIIVIIYMIFRIIGNGYYTMGGSDRFVFRSEVFTALDEKLYNYILWFLPIPLILSNIGMKKSAYGFLGLVCFYYIIVGDKFSSLLMVFYIYLLVCWSTKQLNKKMLRKVVILVSIAISVLLLYVAYQVLYERGGGMATVIVYFQNRITGGQSDLWWKTYKLYKDSAPNLLEIGDEIKAIFSTPSSVLEYNFGIYKMMKLTAPWSVVSSYLNRGARFAASTQASVYYYFKFPGLIIYSIFAGIILHFVVNKAICAYKKMNIIQSVCYTLILQKATLLLGMSDITVLGNKTFLLAIIILLIEKSANKQYKQNVQNVLNVSKNQWG